jgi:hypothetical protein
VPNLDDLERLLAEDAAVRDDFLATLRDFFERHNITVAEEGDVAGFSMSAFPAPGKSAEGEPLSPGGPVGVFAYRDGPNYSRLFDSGFRFQ